MTKKKIKLYFQPDKVNEPITYHLVKEYDIKFNILRAVVEEKGGRLLIEVEGQPAQISKGIAYLQSIGVDVKEMNEYVMKDVSRCTNCGMCVSICPAAPSRWIARRGGHLRSGQVHSLRLCVTACPPQAMKLKI